MQIAPGLRRIGNDLVAVHLVVTEEGVTVIDAGLRGHLRELRRELAAIGRSLADVRGIVLTHGDTDHIGFAEQVRAAHGVPVHVHEADAARARGETSTKPATGPVRVGPLLRFLTYGASRGGLRTRYLTDVQTMTDGAVLPLPGSPQVIALPGHSPGSVAVHVPQVRTVFVGDALTTRNVLTGAVGPQPAPFTDDPAEARAVLARLADLDVDRVVPGHGPVWDGGVPDLLAAYAAAAQV